jgi:cytochrome c
VQNKILFRLASFSLGIALLLAALFFNTGGARPATQVQATPTADRLAEPTLPASPSQADHGAQVWWLSCLPCHGDRGQGLTDEFRLTYPPEEQYCWESGCHGARPYDQGFTLPTQIPAVIGPGTLQKFPNASVLHAYIAAAMPYWKPGSLSEEDSWSVTAFVLRENGLWPETEDLSAVNAEAIPVGPPSTAAPTPSPSPAPSTSLPASLLFPLIGGVTLLGVLLLLARFLRRRGEDD